MYACMYVCVSVSDGPFTGHNMAEPSVEHLMQLMAGVARDRAAAAAVGARGRDTMVNVYSVPHVAAFVKMQLQRITGALAQTITKEEDLRLRQATYKPA
jgi:hypothetical protein